MLEVEAIGVFIVQCIIKEIPLAMFAFQDASKICGKVISAAKNFILLCLAGHKKWERKVSATKEFYFYFTRPPTSFPH